MFYIFHARSQALHLSFHAHAQSNALVLTAPGRISSTEFCRDGSAAAAVQLRWDTVEFAQNLKHCSPATINELDLSVHMHYPVSHT